MSAGVAKSAVGARRERTCPVIDRERWSSVCTSVILYSWRT